jgi:hypothetical protein
MPMSDEEIKALPHKIATHVQEQLKQKFQEALKSISGCSALCHIPTWTAAGKLAKAINGLRPSLEELQSQAAPGEKSDLGQGVNFPVEFIGKLASGVGEVFTSLTDFFKKAGTLIAEGLRNTIMEIGEVLMGFVNLLKGGGFVCGMPPVSKMTSLDKLVPDALKEAPIKIFTFLMNIADASISKFGAMAQAFISLVRTDDLVKEGGVERFKATFASEDEELACCSILALTKMGLSSPSAESDVMDIFKSTVTDEAATGEKKAQAAAGYSLLLAAKGMREAAEAAKKAAEALGNAMNAVPGVGAVKGLMG